jgi:HEAT repeat protein
VCDRSPGKNQGPSRDRGALVGALVDSKLGVQDEASRSLQQMGELAIEPIVELLQNDDWEVRKRAAFILGEFGWTFTNKTEQLEYLSASQNFTALVQIGSESLGVLLDLLKVPDAATRRGAAKALGEIGDKRAVDALVKNLADWSSNQTVIEALSRLEWQPGSDEDRIHTFVARRQGDELRTSWNLSKEILMNDILTDDYWHVENAVNAFMGIGKEEIIPVLERLLDTKGSKTMAEAYLNCGHSALGDAARLWAKQHGYTISKGAGAYPVRWGAF